MSEPVRYCKVAVSRVARSNNPEVSGNKRRLKADWLGYCASHRLRHKGSYRYGHSAAPSMARTSDLGCPKSTKGGRAYLSTVSASMSVTGTEDE